MECHSKCWGSGCLWQGSVGLCSLRGCTTEASSKWVIQNDLLPNWGFCLSFAVKVWSLRLWSGKDLVLSYTSIIACLSLVAHRLCSAADSNRSLRSEVKPVDAHSPLGTGSSLSCLLKDQSWWVCSRAGLCLGRHCLLSCGLVVACVRSMNSLFFAGWDMASCGDCMDLSLGLHTLANPAPGIFFCFLSSYMRRLLSPSTNSVQWPKQTYAVFAGEQDRVSEADYIAYTWNSDF